MKLDFFEIQNSDVTGEFIHVLRLDVMEREKAEQDDRIVPLPYDDDLLPLHEALELYEEERKDLELDYPRKGTMRYLREQGVYEDFLDFKNTLLKKRLKKWLEDHMGEPVVWAGDYEDDQSINSESHIED